eukprot:GHVQ01022009.1.p2 GENE.GHVQ01022009.1~~GHVQ01022009.1.p2  ORF type:complete len:109 (-),score=15.86 GHVQ01022009.1:153-479(-)
MCISECMCVCMCICVSVLSVYIQLCISVYLCNSKLVEATLNAAIPNVLMPALMSLDTLRERVPESYLKAIFSSYLSARYYYKYGLDAEPLKLFDYFEDSKAAAADTSR